MKIDYTEEIKNNLLRALQDKYKNIFFHLIKKLLYKIEKREYTSYKKYESNQIVEKQIVYAYDVKAHRRHFWKDSGRFKIPLMSKEGWERKGYGTDELVYRDGELRRDVPYKIIGNFKVDEDKKERENNREIILFERRRFRQEEKLLKILQKIFPNEFIKRHDRKILNGLELDFIIREKRLAFEYEGEQHYDRKLCEEVFKSDFDSLKIRDRNKDKLCIKKDIKLIRIKYDEPLTIQNIRRKLKNGTR